MQFTNFSALVMFVKLVTCLGIKTLPYSYTHLIIYNVHIQTTSVVYEQMCLANVTIWNRTLSLFANDCLQWYQSNHCLYILTDILTFKISKSLFAKWSQFDAACEHTNTSTPFRRNLFYLVVDCKCYVALLLPRPDWLTFTMRYVRKFHVLTYNSANICKIKGVNDSAVKPWWHKYEYEGRTFWSISKSNNRHSRLATLRMCITTTVVAPHSY